MGQFKMFQKYTEHCYLYCGLEHTWQFHSVPFLDKDPFNLWARAIVLLCYCAIGYVVQSSYASASYAPNIPIRLTIGNTKPSPRRHGHHSKVQHSNPSKLSCRIRLFRPASRWSHGGGCLNDRENERAHLHNHKKQDAPYSRKLQTRK